MSHDSPLDFPQPYEHPPYATLLSCLQSLHIKPPAWSAKHSRASILADLEASSRDRRAVASYLSSIIASPLSWIPDESHREEIWSEASARLSERCGRTAMGEITRVWPFDNHTTPFELTIREPPITGDALGLKTWGSSFVLAQLLPKFKETSLAHLLSSDSKPSVLELGSGTGLLGLAAACLWGVNVVLTDMPGIMSNLRHNAELNREVVRGCGGSMEAAPLMWGCEESDERFGRGERFKLIIVADGCYDDNHPELLAGAVHDQLDLGHDARALIMVPLRDEITKKLITMFRRELARANKGLVCVDEGLEAGQDDWDEDEGSQAVDCWWGVFKRSTTTV